MTLALTNVDLLHRGWEDAVSEITPHLPEVRATMETEYASLLHENRTDEQALLAAVREVAAVAARAAGADKARLLSRSMHRSVYEYLLSLDALMPEETAGGPDDGDVAADPSRLIGMEEVAELEGRQAAIRAEEEAAAAALEAAAQLAAERAAAQEAEAERVAAEERAAAERAAAEAAEADRVAAEERAAAERAAAERAAAHRAAAERAALERAAAERASAARAAQERALAEAEAQRELPGVEPGHADDLEPEHEPDGETSAGGFYRPRFKLFRRGSTHSGEADEEAGEDGAERRGSPSWWRGPEAPPVRLEPDLEPAAPAEEPITPAAHVEPPANGAHSAAPAPAEPRRSASRPDAGFAVQPRDGFHLTEFSDFVRPTPHEAPRPAIEAPDEAAPAADGDGAKARGWHIRSSRRPNSGEADEADADETLDEDAWEERRLLDSDPKVAEAHVDVNDLLRRRKCDEAASLLQKLAADHGSRSVAELALDAGDRCRALGKGNAALSCYIAASRADASFEGPLMRLADVCLDDRDIDLAVTYLERVAKLHRQRGDNRGALRLYRKIATIAPYRDDILATLMRANTTGQFED